MLPFWHALRTRPAAQAAMRGTNAAVVAWMIWALRDPTSGYGAGYVGIFVAILTVLGAILGVSSLVDKSGRVPGAIALAICGAGLLLALYSMIAEGM